MIIPSIDILDGKAVQLRRGKENEKIVERDDIMELADTFSRYGDIAVIDLNAALGKGNNKALIKEICATYPCRVGGGIRDEESARGYLKAGAKKIIIGTRAEETFLSNFCRELLIVAVDAEHGEVVDKGWTGATGESVLVRIKRLENYCNEFLFTQVEREGMMQGINLDIVKQLTTATSNRITAAGGISSIEDIKALEKLNCNSQVGMAIYTGEFTLTDAFSSLLDFSKGLLPTIVQDEFGQVLMLAYSSPESLEQAFDSKRGVYFSRSRNEIWAKGETSGHTQTLLRAAYDCDGDSLLFTVKQNGVACHRQQYSCFGEKKFDPLKELLDITWQRKDNPTQDSYTSKLLDNPELLTAKLREEMIELLDYSDRSNLVWEAGDVFYHMAVLLTREGVHWKEVLNELKGRMR